MRLMAGLGAAMLALAAPAFAQEDGWATEADLAAARSAAPTILIAFMDTVRQPRGYFGSCPAEGQVILFERGRLRGGVRGRVSVYVPCSTQRRVLPYLRVPLRHIPMRFLDDRTFARLYFDERGRLIDYEALRLGPEPLPPGW